MAVPDFETSPFLTPPVEPVSNVVPVESRGILTSEELLKHASAAVTVYTTFDMLAHEASVRAVYEVIRPPAKVEYPKDLTMRVCDFCARFIMLSYENDPETGPFEFIESQYLQAKAITSHLGPTSQVLRKMILNPRDNSWLNEGRATTAVGVLDWMTRLVQEEDLTLQ